MKNTLLALMLVSSLFVISCGADATKPQDAYKNQPTETTTGTKTANSFSVSADANGVYTVNVEDLSPTAGEKVTEIVQVTTTDTAGTKTTNTVSGIKQNADGGIYQFIIDGVTTTTTATVTYKYSKRDAAPTVVKETTGTYEDSTYPLTIYDANFNDENKRFDKRIVSITDNLGIELEYTQYKQEYTYYKDNTIKISKYAVPGDIFKIKYSYTDVETITDTPLTDAVTVDSLTPTQATIQLDAATYAGRSYYLKAILTGTSTSGTTTETIYHDNANASIVPSTGKITVNPTTLTSITSGTYEIWVY